MLSNKRKTRKRKSDANFLPGSVGKAFQSELISLVNSLPAAGDSPDAFKNSYLQSEFLSKYCDANTTSPTVRREAAITKWLNAEKRNAETNTRLVFAEDHDFGYVTYSLLVERTRSIIAKVLGDVPDDLFSHSSHTNGASTRVSRSPKASILKHSGKAHVSESALPYWLEFSRETMISSQEVELVDSSVLFTVPKSSEIDRAACKEPEINLLLQRCCGSHIRRKLRRFGIDLNDQTVNQELARTALSRGLATIDLSAASDSITDRVVWDLLPYDWYHILNSLRVHSTIVDDKVVDLEMFSSMGNGFTFELESLIFWALTRAIAWSSGVKGKISVYGDDIIAPVKIARRLRSTFAFFGFRINTKKSNWTGSFRESCGKHYYRGYEVTPFYIREPVRRKTDVIRLLNRLLEWDGRGWNFFITEELSIFHQKWSNIMPRAIWGGPSTDDITSLVTGHKPRQRLMQRSRALKLEQFEEDARYLNWHTSRVPEGDFPLALEPAYETRFIIGDHKGYTETTTWTPWLTTESERV